MKVAIAHESSAIARAVSLALEETGEHELIWTAGRGAEVLRRATTETPQLLLLDVCLTEPNSVEVTRTLMAQSPCAILLLADRPQQRMSRVYEAMGCGALDVITAPSLDARGAVVGHEALIRKLQTMIRLLGSSQVSARSTITAPRRRQSFVAIGASTGGPQALYQILSELPKELHASIVIVQHVDSEFSSGLATWLQLATSMRVELAAAGCQPTADIVLIATSSDHLVMTAQGTFVYTCEPRETPYRPSVDALFLSLAQHWPIPGTAVLLTGMGRDGARGLLQLKEAGWHTLAQDEASSVVFGMPKAAIELGAAQRVLPISDMAHAIARACQGAT